jgi:hypothetical protein
LALATAAASRDRTGVEKLIVRAAICPRLVRKTKQVLRIS